MMGRRLALLVDRAIWVTDRLNEFNRAGRRVLVPGEELDADRGDDGGPPNEPATLAGVGRVDFRGEVPLVDMTSATHGTGEDHRDRCRVGHTPGLHRVTSYRMEPICSFSAAMSLAVSVKAASYFEGGKTAHSQSLGRC